MRKIKGRKLGALSLSLLLGLSLAGCGSTGKKTESTENKEALTKITFCLDWTPNTNHTGI